MTILETSRFNAIAEAIAQLEPCQYAHRITTDQIKSVLVEYEVIPVSVADDKHD